MKHLASNLKILVIAAVVGLATSYAFAWVGAPSQTPPNCTTPSNPGCNVPVNVGSTNQTKGGLLSLLGGTITNGMRSYLPVYIFAESETVPTGTPEFDALKVAVNGKVGAVEYCDENGQNCVDASTGSSINAPLGAVLAFNRDTCPSGWILADGQNGTIDLRGSFVRGLDKGAGKDPGPDGNTATNDRTLASYQADDFKSHTHNTQRFANAGQNKNVAGGSQPYWGFISAWGTGTYATGGPETRPKNVALLYCEKL